MTLQHLNGAKNLTVAHCSADSNVVVLLECGIPSGSLNRWVLANPHGSRHLCGPDGQMWESQIIQSALNPAEKSSNGNGNMLEQLEEPEVLKTESRYVGIWFQEHQYITSGSCIF